MSSVQIEILYRKLRHQRRDWEALFVPAAEAQAKHQKLWNKHFSPDEFCLSCKDSSVYNDQLRKSWQTFWQIETRIRPVIRELKLGHREHVLPALAYLADPGRHFRSGYNVVETTMLKYT